MSILSEKEAKSTDASTGSMIQIPAGPFTMGSNAGGPFEGPEHEVKLPKFWIDKFPVTNAEFAHFAQKTGYKTEAEIQGGAYGFQNGEYKQFIEGLSWQSFHLAERAHHPVVLVSWNDAVAYAKWAGKRLPSEAEWEKAARGGLKGALYPWGESEPNGTQSNLAQSPSEIPPTTPVNQFSPNGYGLYDIVGNVWQWCADWYQEDIYAQRNDSNIQGPAQGKLKVRRGGSWNVIQSFRLRCANRGALPPEAVVPNIGFRCAKDAE